MEHKFVTHLHVENLQVGHHISTGFGSIYEIRGIVAKHGLVGFRRPVEVHLFRVEGTEGDAETVFKTETDGGTFSVYSSKEGVPYRNINPAVAL